jgi:hypothetical protein
MARTIKTSVPIAEIYFEEDLYPRSATDWQTIYIYSQSMKSGAKFPPITLAILNGKKILVDGKHRIEAFKNLKREKIDAEVFTGWDRRKIFEESVKRNISHGRTLSAYDKRRIVLKLRNLKFKDSEISKLVNVPQDKLEHFVGQSLVSATTGKIIFDTILKAPLRHKSGGQYSTTQVQDMELAQTQMSSRSQIYIVKEFKNLLENDLIDTADKTIMEMLSSIKSYLARY